MIERPVAVFDSGIGGLPYLAGARLLLPRHRFVYVADHANFPYGEKSPQDLRRRVVRLTARLVAREDPEAILVACNTASVVALAELRTRFAMPFVGVVPAVKPAASQTRTRRIGVLATARTVEERYLSDLVRQFAGQCTVTAVAAGEIVRLVEEHYGQPPAADVEAAVGAAVRQLLDDGVDTVVLGCTHFVFLLPQLHGLFGTAVAIVDSREGVARQLQRVVEEGARQRPETQRPDRALRPDRFYCTATISARLHGLARDFGFDEVDLL